MYNVARSIPVNKHMCRSCIVHAQHNVNHMLIDHISYLSNRNYIDIVLIRKHHSGHNLNYRQLEIYHKDD